MKKIFTLLFLLFSFVGFSQKIVDRANGASTVRDMRLMAGLNFYAPRYNDTTAANAGSSLGLDTCGALIYTYNTDSYWYRACFPVKHWVQVGSGSSSGTNIYNSDGILTGDRTLSGSNTHALIFDSLSAFGTFSYTDATNYTVIQQDPTEVSIRSLHNGVDNFVSVGAGTVQLRAEDSINLSYPGAAPSVATLGSFKLQARSPTGGLVDYTGSAGATFIDSLQLDSLTQRYGLSGWGDSFTAGFTQLVGGYPEYLANMSGRIMLNNGVGGAVSQNILTFFLAGSDQWNRGTVIWSGYNNRDQATIIIANCSAMADSLIAHGNRRFVFNTILNGPADSLVAGVPYTWYDSIIKVQTQLEARYPGHVADVRGFLVTKYNPALPADATAFHQNQIPPSLRTDGVHLTTLGYYYVARYLDSLFGSVLYDRDYSTYVMNANRIVNLTQGLLPNMGVQDLGAFYIGNMQYLYRPDRYNAPDNYIGSNGGRLITTATKNTTLGIGAGLALTTGSENTLLGYNVGKLLTTPSNNTFIGSSAGTNTTLGFNNVGVGYQVMLGTNAFARNTAIGNSSQRNVSDGTDNTSVGESSLAGNQDGLNNVVVGRAAASNGTSVNRMSVVGANNCTQCSVGDVVSMGYQAMFNNTAGTRNTVISQQGLFGNLVGNDNVTLGYRAAFGTNGFTMSEYRNTAIGTLAIGQIRNQANDNIAVGYRAIMDSITGSNNIAICDSCDLQSRTGSDQGTIGNVIFINGGMGHATTVGAGRVSIGVAVANANALFELSSTSKAFLPMRLTTAQIAALSSPVAGMHVINSDSSGRWAYYTGSAWAYYGTGSGGGGGGTGTVTSVATNTATGITGGTITTTGTIAADTLLLATRLWRQKGIDSVAALIAAGGGITINTTAITSGTIYRVLFESATNKVSELSGFTFDGVRRLAVPDIGMYKIGTNVGLYMPNQTSFPSSIFVGDSIINMAAGASLNTTLGTTAGKAITTAVSNVFIGSRAGQATTTATNSVAVGDAALFGQTSAATQNTAIGKSALQSVTTSSNNTAVGASALLNNTAAQNTAIGVTAGNANSSGADNVLAGFQAGFQNATGGQNVWIGSGAGVGVGGNNNSNNTGVGFSAGRNITTGKGNTLIGDSAGRTITTALRAIVIGTNLTDNGDYSLNLGGAIFGTGMTGTGLTPTGSIGISVVSPTARLMLPAGTATASTAPLKFTSGTNLTSAEGGAVEYDGTDWYGTNGTATRGTFARTVTNTSNSGTATLAAGVSDYIFSGTTTTWTLPALTSSTNVKFYIKNRGSGNITINSSAGGNDIYTTSAVSTTSVTPGSAIILVSDGTFWNLE